MWDDDSGHFSIGARLSRPSALALHFRAQLSFSSVPAIDGLSSAADLFFHTFLQSVLLRTGVSYLLLQENHEGIKSKTE